MKKITFLVPFLLIFLGAFGQGSDIIDLEGTGMRKVEPAFRLTENPKIIDTTIATRITEYPLLVLLYPTSITLDTIQAAKVRTSEKLPQLYSFYAKAGIGSELMPLGELYFDSKRSRKYIYGAHAKHLSSWGNMKNYAPSTFDRTGLGLYGGINENRYTLRGDLRYNNQGFNYYGIEIPTDSVSRDSIAQRYNDVGAAFSFASHKKDSANLNYKVGLEYNYFTSKKPLEDSLVNWKGRENFFAVKSSAFYKLGKEIFAADLGVRYNGYRYGMADSSLSLVDTAIVLNNTVINLKPTISTYLQDDRFKATIGFDLVIDAHQKTKAYLYPAAELKYSMFNDIFIPYIGLRGGLKQNTYRSLAGENEFILTNVVLRNESTMFDFYGGIKGTLSKRMSFNVGASFARIRDKALFVTDTVYSIGNKFNVIYDTLNMATIEGSLSYQMNEKLKVDGIGRYYSYMLLNNVHAWNLPRMQFMIRGHYNLFDKFIVNLDLNMEEGRKALVYAPGEGIVEQDGQYIKNLGFLADVNLGLEYRYNKRLSAFIQFNNVASQRYFRWYNYPVQIFQVMGGVTARF